MLKTYRLRRVCFKRPLYLLLWEKRVHVLIGYNLIIIPGAQLPKLGYITPTNYLCWVRGGVRFQSS